MSIGMTAASSQWCLKRLLDKPQDNLPKWKVARLDPDPPATGLSHRLRPRSPAPKSNESQSPTRVGSYFLLERCEGDKTYRAEHAHTKQQYTCQVLTLRGYQERLAAYARVGHHDNICGLLDVVIGQDRVYVFLPAHHGDMHVYLRSRKRLGEQEAGLLFAQMLHAVTHCHHHGVVLRDLKLRRFVFIDKCRTRLALLGLNDCVLLRGNHDDDSLTDRHGCPAYVSPELLTNGSSPYSGRAADIWSLGVSLYTMLIGRYPFQDTQPAALFTKIRHGAFSLPDWLSPRAKCLIGCMLRKSPAERLTASELLMHPWLNNPRTTHHSTHKTHHSSHKTLQNKQEDDDQVVPTWTEKH
ncbi:tribbles homolog 2-like [Cottoperca gobio]|uniref:Tribbles homolog 2-like n=1 Tax=Cottoperca gobio TaxID=56716 RepID=A0A6J2PMX5_COTGO|nr:tribbles homolog 2-like [Cottoperca gobio]XP_029287509.1 tribbles homolog 2-like [Cottoperca gobio]XP_029287510.1 tribbles homolog 2-like [Cottoperca gobio]XP_029287511.1 tribbles homolog 2-like [Cottoperca gobio]